MGKKMLLLSSTVANPHIKKGQISSQSALPFIKMVWKINQAPVKNVWRARMLRTASTNSDFKLKKMHSNDK